MKTITQYVPAASWRSVGKFPGVLWQPVRRFPSEWMEGLVVFHGGRLF